jgi:hypothetical protein
MHKFVLILHDGWLLSIFTSTQVSLPSILKFVPTMPLYAFIMEVQTNWEISARWTLVFTQLFKIWKKF